MNAGKKYLITGGAGFIGANFVKYLLKKYDNEVKIMVLDALTYAGHLPTIANDLQRNNVNFTHGDIGDEAVVTRLLGEFDPDFVVNFAAESHVDRSITGPRVFLETNILGTHNMLECVRKAWLNGTTAEGKPSYREGKKFIQISTDEVYGSLQRRYSAPQELTLSDDVAKIAVGRHDLKTFGNDFFTEATPLSPRSPYSASKTSADMFVMAYHETYGLPINITRCSNNYGPYQFPEKLIPLVINNIIEGKQLPVYGRGENVRDWLYVDDHCKAIDIVARRGKVGEVYNIGGFNEQENISIVKLIIRLVREQVEAEPAYQSLFAGKVDEIDERLISYVTDRPGHDMRYAIDPTKIVNELGWYPETCFEEGIRKTVKWYLNNVAWCNEVRNKA